MTQDLLGGRYRIGRLIGSGGMASVYEGEHTRLKRPVAIKVLHPREARTASAVARFENEAYSIARLNHPSIVQVYDFWDEGGQYFIAMELVKGDSLKDEVRGGPLPANRVIDIGVQIAKALEYAHSQGIVHGDVKPQNILLMPDGGAKLVDFGIAATRDAAAIAETDSVLGTVHYIAPEQAQGKPISQASDVYALGVVLYEALTGRVPFDGSNLVEIAKQHVSALPIEPSRLNPSIPRALDAAILHAMEKDPAHRPASAGDFARELLQYDELQSQTTSYIPRPKPAGRNLPPQGYRPAHALHQAHRTQPSSSPVPIIGIALLALFLVAGLVPLWINVLQNYRF